MSAVGKGWIPTPDQPQPGLVHQGGWLERVPRGFAGHFARRQSTQLVVDQRKQLVRSRRVPFFHRDQDTLHVTHRTVVPTGYLPSNPLLLNDSFPLALSGRPRRSRSSQELYEQDPLFLQKNTRSFQPN